MKDVDAIIAGGDEISARVIETADKLKVIARYGVGCDTIDLEAAARRNIPVAVAPNEDAVANHTFGLLLCLTRRVCESNNQMKAGEWKQVVGVDIEHKTLGVIGTGRIGRALIKRARAFDMKILAHDIFEDEECAQKLGFEYTSLENLLSQSDFVSLHCPLNETTRGLLSKDRLALMRSTAYLINTARAQIVDEEALYRSLKEKRLAGAAIDVYSQVPPPKDFPFFTLNNVIMTAWLGSNTIETRRSMELTCVENVLRVLRGGRPLYVV